MEAKNPYRTKKRPNNSYATIYERGFKAGMQEEAKGGHNSISYLEGYQEGEKQGARKVVDWVKEEGYGTKLDGNFGIGYSHMVVDWDKWQAFLEELGIKED